MEIQSASRPDKAVLGEGYNTKEERFAGECVTGTRQFAGAQDALIDFQRSMSSTEMADSLGFSIGGSVRYGLIKGSMSAKFASESSASDYSEVTIYSARYNFKNAKLNFTGLTPVGEAAKGSSADSNFVWENWEKTCGHEYVEQIVLGASLYIAIKLEFSSKAEKMNFNAEFNISGPMFEAGGALELASKKFGKKASVTIQAYQLGGDVSKLSQALSGRSNVNVTTGEGEETKNVSALISCSMENPGACLDLLDRAMQYAEHEFPQQIKPDLTPDNPAGPAELVYITRPWEELALYPPPALIAAGVKAARQDLSFQFEQNLKYRNRVRALKTDVLRLSPSQQDKIDAIDTIVSDNLRLINEGAEVCYSQMDQCVAKVDEVKENLKSFNEKDFDIFPETIAQWYDIKDLPDTDKATKHTMDVLVEIVRAIVNDFDNAKDKAKTAERELNDLTELNLSGKHIVDLKPLASLTNLTSLSLDSNQIVDVKPLSSLTGLTSLSLNYNQIVDVKPLSSLTNLTSLLLDSNQIMDVKPLSSLTNLTKLGLSDNQIADASPLSSLTKLKYLTIAGNPPIENVKSLSSLTNLVNLFLTTDQISVVEGGAPQYEWQGTWTRRNQSNIFDAYWRHTHGGEVRDVIELAVIESQKVTLYRQGLAANYYGPLSPDRQEVVNGIGAWFQSGETWSAKVKSD